jgi:hypothetical protein
MEARGHQGIAEDLRAGTTSCLKCHAVAHDFDSVEAGRLWQAEVK